MANAMCIIVYAANAANFFLLTGNFCEYNTNRITQILVTTVEPPIKDPLRKGQPLYKGHSSGPHSYSSSTLLTSEKRTTSQQRTKRLIPRCPLFRGSTRQMLHQSKRILCCSAIAQPNPICPTMIFLSTQGL